MPPLRSARIERLSISLPRDLAEAVRDAVETRRFASVSEVIRDDLREWQLTSGIARTPGKSPPEPRRSTRSDITPDQLFELEIMGDLRRVGRFAVRGSTQKGTVDAAATFPDNPVLKWTPEEARRT